MSSSLTAWSDFNPHIREGCDTGVANTILNTMIFQSTHPWRMWRHLRLQCRHARWISIHTSVKDVTEGHLTWQSSQPLFQSTHPWRMWQPGLHYYLLVYRISIHTSVKDVTRCKITGDDSRDISIHTSVKDVTMPDNLLLSVALISIHTSVKDVTKATSTS